MSLTERSRADSAADAYNRIVAADPLQAIEQSQWLEEEFTRQGITFGGEAMRSFLRPHFVEVSDWETLTRVSRRVMEIATRVARDVFEGDVGRLLDHLGTPDAEARWVRIDPGVPDVVFSRVDAFETAAGPRLIEINSDAPAGFGYGDRMASVFRRLPIFERFTQANQSHYVESGAPLVLAMCEAYRAAGRSGTPQVAIVDWRDVKTRADQEILRDHFERAGVPTVLADPRELEVRKSALWAGEFRIDLVFRRTVLTEIAPHVDEVRHLLRAYEEGLAVFANSFRCRLAEDKAFFGILTDETFSALLTSDEIELIAQAVPWTRRMEERRTRFAGEEIDLIPWVAAHRDSLVLKPTHGYGGEAVVIGSEATESQWDAAIHLALQVPHVVQRRVEIPEAAFPVCEGGSLAFESLKLNCNPFYLRTEAAGAIARLSRDSVINVSAGGGAVPVLTVS